jgi:hypothetical protein
MLSIKDKITGYIAKWIVAYVAASINATAVMSLCLETSRKYNAIHNGEASKKFDSIRV